MKIMKINLEHETIDVEYVDGPPQRSAVCAICGEKVFFREWAEEDEVSGGCEHTVSRP